jgi:hypothetical protein
MILTKNTVKRHRRTNDELAQIDQEIMDVFNECHPQSVRHCFYRLTDPRLPVFVPKTDSGANNGYGVVQRRIVKLRRNGTLPYGWVTDFTRRGYHVDTYKNRGEFIRKMATLYRVDLWSQADCRVEVWCESRSIAGVIEDLCYELGVSLYPSGGFSSLTLVYQSSELIKDVILDTSRPINVIYIGDYDPAGVLIDRAIERELRGHLGARTDLTFHRIGINADHVTEYGLPTKPRKAGDRRALHVESTVEAEALPAPIMLRLLREKIETFLPPRALAEAKEKEKEEQNALWLLGSRLEGAR